MTTQENESIEYRGQDYLLFGEPLEPYLKNNSIEFSWNDSALWRGYKGHWILKENKLFIDRLDDCDISFMDLFETDEKVLAEWFSGTLRCVQKPQEDYQLFPAGKEGNSRNL